MIKANEPASGPQVEPTSAGSTTPPAARSPSVNRLAIPVLDADLFAQVREVQTHLKQFTAQYPAWVKDMKEAQRRVAANLRMFRVEINQALEAITPIFTEIARTSKECRRIEAAGWLPHYTTPFDRLATCPDEPDLVQATIAAYYLEEWPAIQATFIEHLASYDIDDEAKATFTDVLEAHGQGFYRLTSRCLFPEIERVVRAEIHEGSLQPITSQKELRRLVESLGLLETQPGGLYAMSLYQKLLKHLYENTKTVEELEAVAKDAVPNRHASLHGLLPYGSQQNSVNAIIMTDFIFQIVCALKRRALEDDDLA